MDARRALAVLLVLLVPHVAAAARWTEVRTPHCVFIGDARAADIRAVAARFERFYAIMQSLTSREAVSPPAPTVVFVFAGVRSFRPHMPLRDGKRVDVAGVFWGGADINYVGINAEYGEQGYPIVFHELTHLITANVLRNPPLWVVEGFAEYYSTFEMRSDTEVLLGRPIDAHAGLLREQFIPLAELLAADHRTSFYNEGHRRPLFYAQSWALVHLLRSNPATHARFLTYLRSLDRGAAQAAAVREAFGMDIPELESALRAYARQFSMRAELLRLEQPLTRSAMTTADMPEAAAVAHLARLHLRAGRLDDAEAGLNAAMRLDPRLRLAHTSLAQLRLRQGRAAEACTQADGGASSTEFLDAYLAAYLASDCLDALEPGHARDAARERLQDEARRATDARADVAEAWRLLADAAVEAHDGAAAKMAIDRALALAPMHEPYRFRLADVLVLLEDFAGARGVLGALMAHGQTADIRDAARTAMGSLVTYERTRASGASDVRPVFRERREDETRVTGLLLGIECAAAAITLVLETSEGVLRVRTPGFDAVEFVTYRDDLAGEVTCGRRAPPDAVFVTWPGGQPAGELVEARRAVVEFLPR